MTQSHDYEHTQAVIVAQMIFGFLVFLFLAASAGKFAGGEENAIIFLGAAAFCAVIVALFYSMTVRVSRDSIFLFSALACFEKTSSPAKSKPRKSFVSHGIPGGA